MAQAKRLADDQDVGLLAELHASGGQADERPRRLPGESAEDHPFGRSAYRLFG
ncbi:MAG TPA: hypothetical protein VGC04_13455 [Cellulomonas sp.]